MSIDLKKLEHKLDEALSNETTETLTKFLTDKTMSTNKQSSVELFIEQLEEKGGAWENVSIRRVQISIDVSEYMELKTKAKAMHKEEIIDAYHANPLESKWQNKGFGYYTETFGCNNEQQ